MKAPPTPSPPLPLSITPPPLHSPPTFPPLSRSHKPIRLPNKLPRNRQPGHNVQLDGLLTAQELDFLNEPEAEAGVEFEIEDIAAFEIADAVF